MSITLDLPPDIERLLTTRWNDELPRKILEAVASEGYRQEIFTHREVGELLGLDRWETDAFLKERGAFLHYDQDDFEADTGIKNGASGEGKPEKALLPLHLTLTPEEFREELEKLRYGVSADRPPLSDEDISRETIYD